jgi:Protein of unknown function (DUF4058)
MPSPFPGMDPYLESPVLWPDVHHELISEIRAALNLRLRPRYVARVELRVYISDEDDPGREALVPDLRVKRHPRRKGGRQSRATAPAVTEPVFAPTLMDEEIKEAFLKILHLETEDLVTLIEVLSPTNKIRGSRGRASFMSKRQEIMNTEIHWVEIDLLRAGVHSVSNPPLHPSSDYRILASRSDQRTRTHYWPVGVRDALPVISIPLRGKDPEVPLDLGAVFRTVYDRAAYDVSIDYRKPPRPPLEGEDAKWARDLLRGRGAKPS